MLFKINEFFIDAVSEREAFAKYVAYYFDCGFSNMWDMDAEAVVISDELTVEEFFDSVTERLLDLYPDLFIDEFDLRYVVNIVLKKNDANGKRIKLVVISEHIKGVFTLGVGIGDNNGYEFSILPYPGSLNGLIEDINNKFEEYLKRI